MMGAGKLDRRIRIERPVTIKDAKGAATQSWALFATLWANVEEVLPSRGERLAEGLNISQRQARVRTKYVEGITSEMRVVYLDRSNRVMRILTQPVEMGRRDGLEFMAADYTPQGNAP